MEKIVYILSDNRSGSTLLDQLLGAHEQVVSLGEVQHLLAYVLQDRTLYNPVHPLDCSCGETVEQCSFWSEVEKRLGRPFESLVLKPRLFGKSGGLNSIATRARYFLRRTVEDNPRLLRRRLIANLLNGPRVAKDSLALYESVSLHSSATCLIDSSKSVTRFRMLYYDQPHKMYAIFLGRDYRGTVHSKMKRGRSLETGIQSWSRYMRQLEDLKDDIPAHQRIRVRYEDLCADPRAEMMRICRFLNLEFSEAMLSRPSEDIHHIGGSPSKFDPDRKKIKLDLTYRDAFTPEQLATMREAAGEAAADWGYD